MCHILPWGRLISCHGNTVSEVSGLPRFFFLSKYFSCFTFCCLKCLQRLPFNKGILQIENIGWPTEITAIEGYVLEFLLVLNMTAFYDKISTGSETKGMRFIFHHQYISHNILSAQISQIAMTKVDRWVAEIHHTMPRLTLRISDAVSFSKIWQETCRGKVLGRICSSRFKLNILVWTCDETHQVLTVVCCGFACKRWWLLQCYVPPFSGARRNRKFTLHHVL